MTTPPPVSSDARFARLPTIALWLSVALVTLAAWLAPHRLYFDQAWQLIAVRDYVEGATAGPNWIRSALPADLSRDAVHWSFNWPPGYSFSVLGLHAITGDFARAHRLLAWLCVVVGAVGWYRLLARVPGLPGLWQAAGILIIVIGGPAAYSVVELHPEVFVFAVTPWQLWLGLMSVDSNLAPGRRAALLSALGGLVGIAYAFKYSAALTGIPLLAAVAFLIARRLAHGRILAITLLAVSAVLPVAALSLYNRAHVDGINPTTSRNYHQAFRLPTPVELANLASGPLQAMAGSEIILARTVDRLLGPPRVLSDYPRRAVATASLALLSVLVLTAAICTSARRDFLLTAALTANAFVIVALIWIWGGSTIASDEARHFTGLAFFWYPVLLGALHTAWLTRRKFAIVGLMATSPAMLGAVLYLYAVTRSCVALPHAAQGGFRLDPALDIPRLHAQVQAQAGIAASDVVWVCFEPRVHFALHGRRLAESYKSAVVDYAARTRTAVIILVPSQPPMDPSVYRVNLLRLGVELSHPDFVNADYYGFVRWVGPQGLEPLPGAQASRPS